MTTSIILRLSWVVAWPGMMSQHYSNSTAHVLWCLTLSGAIQKPDTSGITVVRGRHNARSTTHSDNKKRSQRPAEHVVQGLPTGTARQTPTTDKHGSLNGSAAETKHGCRRGYKRNSRTFALLQYSGKYVCFVLRSTCLTASGREEWGKDDITHAPRRIHNMPCCVCLSLCSNLSVIHPHVCATRSIIEPSISERGTGMGSFVQYGHSFDRVTPSGTLSTMIGRPLLCIWAVVFPFQEPWKN